MSAALVDPAKFVVRAEDLDPDAVFAAAGELRGLGVAVAAASDGAATRWSGLAGCYVAPEAEQVLGLLGPVVDDGQQVADMFTTVAGHLHLYAIELAMIRPRLVTLQTEAQAFRDEVSGGVTTSVVGEPGWAAAGAVLLLATATQGWKTVPWHDHEGTCDRNDELLDRYARLLSQVQQSVADCADAVNRAVSPLARWLPGTPVYSPQQWLATAQPWGAPGPADRSLLEQVYGGAGDWVMGWAPFAGYDPVTGRVGLDVRMAAQGEMYNAAWSVAVVSVASSPAGFAALGVAGDKLPLAVRVGLARRATVVRDTGASVIGYDPYDTNVWHRWKDEPWRQATVVGIDLATAAVPGGLAAHSAKAATGASRTARLAAAARGALDGLVPGASTLPRNPGAGSGSWTAAMNDLRNAATHSGTDPASVLSRLDSTTPPVPHHHPAQPRFSDSLATGHDHPGGQSWLYQDTPTTTHPPTPDGTSSPASARTTSPDPAPGRAADTITTQPIPELPRTTHEPPRIDAPTRPGDGTPGTHPGGNDAPGPAVGTPGSRTGAPVPESPGPGTGHGLPDGPSGASDPDGPSPAGRDGQPDDTGAGRRPDDGLDDGTTRGPSEQDSGEASVGHAGTEVNTSRSLGEDPAVGRFRQGEYDTAIRIQQERGVTLERSDAGMSSDWVDSSGSTYDAVGNFDSRHFDTQWPNLQRQIVRHLDKADYVPVDVSRFTPDQVELVRDFISDLGSRVFIIGEQL